MLKSKLLSATAAAGELLAIEDVFSTWLYTGNGSTQTITNGIDLAGEGGLVWFKNRPTNNTYHALYDTERGTEKYLMTNVTSAEQTFLNNGVTSFNADGFTVAGTSDWFNASGQNIASWTFRKAPRFFDVVTYTGNSTARTISHNLGVTPGCIIVKAYSGSISGSQNWPVWHRSIANTEALFLNTTDAKFSIASGYWNSTSPTSTEFSLGAANAVNGTGMTYVAYLFAHDPLGPSGDGSDGLIACGSYTGNGSSNGPEITLGWEPQWILVKRTDSADNWFLVDIMRGITTSGADPWLLPNTSGAESTITDDYIDVTATGFKLKRSTGEFNANGGTYIYIAIRRGPMREPTSGTEVFDVQFNGGNDPSRAPVYQSGFVTDMAIVGLRTGGSVNYPYTGNRLMGIQTLETHNTDAEESGGATFQWDFMDGFIDSVPSVITDTQIAWMFRRAPGFFDVVAYTGNQTNRTISHNLGAVPEIMIHKSRDQTVRHWIVYHKDIGTSAALCLDLIDSTSGVYSADYWNATAPTDTVFSLGSAYNATNANNSTFITYLFATLPGVSKVGSYTGNGSSQTINCGFTGGARFVLIKRTDSTGDWLVYDTARGINVGDDPRLFLNNTNAEVSDTNSINVDGSGFSVNNDGNFTNASGGSYIFLAIA